MALNKVHLIYHPNDKGFFKSDRWGKDYTPDLLIVTRTPIDDNTLCNRYIIESFPVLLHYGILVPLTELIEKPRWNFSSVDWKAFASDIYHVVRFIPACSESYKGYSNASKRQAGIRIVKICTKNIIPIMTQPLQIFYLEELNDQRKRKWKKTAWSLLRKLDTDLKTGASSPTHQKTANYIASRLQRVLNLKSSDGSKSRTIDEESFTSET
jgi:hypothetical protein